MRHCVKEVDPLFHPKVRWERIVNELRMHFRRERRNGVVVSLQETLEAGKEDSALTLSDVLQDGFCMEDACERRTRPGGCAG